MENRVGDNVPTPAKLAALLKQLQDVVAEIKKFGVILTKDERRRLLRVRRDSEAMQRLIYAIAQKRGARAKVAPSLREAIDEIVRLGEPTAVTGSLTLAGQAASAFGRVT